MPGLKDFVTESFSARNILIKAATYTVLAEDEHIKINGTYTMTLPVLSTLRGTLTPKKSYKFENIHATGIGTVAAGTGNTIGGRTSITLQPGEHIVISGSEAGTDWTILRPYPLPPGIRNFVDLWATTTAQSTAVNLVDASGCPVVGIVVHAEAWALDTNAGNIAIKNSTDTICTIAKSTTAGLPVAGTTLTTPQMAVGDTLTCETSTTNGNARVHVVVSTQTLTKGG